MNQCLLFISFLLAHLTSYAQTSSRISLKLPLSNKPTIDTTAIFNWPHLYNDCSISPNGNYIIYKVNCYSSVNSSLVLQSTNDTSWRKEITGAMAICFTRDEKCVIYRKADSLYRLTLPSGQLEIIAGVKSIRQPRVGIGTWLAYQLKNEAKEVVLLNLITGENQHFTSVNDYGFSDNGKILLLNISMKKNDRTVTNLQLWDFQSNKLQTIWGDENSAQIANYKFDLLAEQLVFTVKNVYGNTIWYYRNGMSKAVEKVNNKTDGIPQGLWISNDQPFFNRGGNYILFKLQKPAEILKPNPNAVKVDVWSYKDVQLIPEQSPTPSGETFTSVIRIDASNVVKVEEGGEEIVPSSLQRLNHINCDYLVVAQKNSSEFWWKDKSNKSYYLVSLRDGSRKKLREEWTYEFLYSPAGKYIIYFNAKEKHYYSYEIATGKTRNITKGITERIDNENVYYVPGRTYPLAIGIGGWFTHDGALLIYGNYDIWKVDPKGKRIPVSITNEYGKKHQIRFRLVYERDEYNQELIHNEQDTLLLTAFSTKTKYNGFYKQSINIVSNPQIAVMGPFLYYRHSMHTPDPNNAFDNGMSPIKAASRDLWLIKRQCPTEAPNYFVTNDFKKFNQITDVKPQERYNWLTTELVNYDQLDGSRCQGILYKPENFDPSKKYPVLFYYYESMSYRMYEYPKPGLADARFDIPWFVSRGYLVFTPDIHYSIANISGKLVGDHAVNSIVGAAHYLSKLPFVDGKRMGIQGHSFAGGETLYIITHSKKFAAACAAACTVSDEISAYLSFIRPNGKAASYFRLAHAETGHDMIGATLWDRPDLFINASPIFKANQVATPLLIMHNQEDGATDWGQSIEMYMALRRLQKPVWMLQYDNENHQIINVRNAIDFTIRMSQFFDHYLKQDAAPEWMIDGIPAAMKGVKTGYSLLQTGECAKECKVCVMLNKKMKTESVAKEKAANGDSKESKKDVHE